MDETEHRPSEHEQPVDCGSHVDDGNAIVQGQTEMDSKIYGFGGLMNQIQKDDSDCCNSLVKLAIVLCESKSRHPDGFL